MYHSWYITKDVTFAPRNDPIPTNAIIKMVDVDYYIDWSDWLQHERPVLLYTFVPDEVVYRSGEYSYALSESEVEMEVSGGQRYNHQLWNYSKDHALVYIGKLRWVEVSIDVKRVDRHHRIILVNPIRTIRWFGFLLPSDTIERMWFGSAGNVCHQYRNGDGEFTSVGVGSPRATACATIPTRLWEPIRLRLAASKHPNVSDVERYLRAEQISSPALAAPVLFEVIRTMTGVVSQVTHSPGEFQPLRYQATEGLITEDGKEIGRALCPSLVTNPDVIPNRSHNNDLASITGRVMRVLNDKEPPPRYLGYARDFVDYLVKDTVNTGMPWEIQEVIDIQSRPTQRGRSEMVKHWISRTNPVVVRAFMKGESYSKISDPRNISTVGAEHTLRLSAYTYAFKYSALYPKEWYAPGKKPSDIAHRVAALCLEYSCLAETDFSRYDGTISRWLRTYVERPAYLRWAHPDVREDLGELLSAEINPKASTSHGLPYSPASSRLSGSPLTTDGNTIINAFVTYAAAREAGRSHRDAILLFGIYAGDDGISPVKPAYLEKVSGHLGLKLKCIRREGVLEGKQPITFLGRVFYKPTVEGCGSIQDPMRTWRKLHYSFAQDYISDRQAIANRAAGYLALDPEAPVVGHWARAVQRITGLNGAVTEDGPYFAHQAELTPEFGGWPQMAYEDAMEVISLLTELSVSELETVCDKLDAAGDFDAFSELINNTPSAPTISAVSNGEVHTPPEDTLSVATAVVSQRERRDRRRPKTHPKRRAPRQ
jgi:hypothetical protein